MAATWSRGRGFALRLVAVAEGVLAAGFLLAGLLTPLRVLLIPAVVLAAAALLIMYIARKMDDAYDRRQRLLRDGLDATATVTAMRQTAITYNGQPQVILDLSVTVGARPPYPLQLKEFVPMIYVGRLTSDRPLAVKVDPDDSQHIAIDWSRSA